ncbi:hypothetical protein IKG45_01730 [Candidatus Saccharibacteria bacterium]|nr:hypothetical protein [Candidatus Saccharibacteria bacterium]
MPNPNSISSDTGNNNGDKWNMDEFIKQRLEITDEERHAEFEEGRKKVAGELGLPEDSSWDEIHYVQELNKSDPDYEKIEELTKRLQARKSGEENNE